jgi:hypothetical protein
MRLFALCQSHPNVHADNTLLSLELLLLLQIVIYDLDYGELHRDLLAVK